MANRRKPPSGRHKSTSRGVLPRPEDFYPSLRKDPRPAKRRAKLLAEAAAKGVKPVDQAALDAMGEVWPEHEPVDEFLAWLYESRHTGRYS